jgi:hypothetical protein
MKKDTQLSLAELRRPGEILKAAFFDLITNFSGADGEQTAP